MSSAIRSRLDWAAREPKSRTPIDVGAVTYSFVHWPGSTRDVMVALDSPDFDGRVASCLRGWQRYHMESRGWTDIAYNFAVDQRGQVWSLRGWNRDGATKGYGGVSLSILAVLGDGEEPTADMLEGIVAVQQMIEDRCHNVQRLWHSAKVLTSCPGPKLTAWAKAGFPVAPKPEPVPTPDPEVEARPILRATTTPPDADHRKWTRHLQAGLLRVFPTYSYPIRLNGGADGVYGRSTLSVVAEFQRRSGLDDDGVVGPKTWAELALYGI